MNQGSMDTGQAHAHKNSIAVGVICPEAFFDTVSAVLKSFPSFAPEILAYRDENEAPALAEELAERAEVLFFTGPIPYSRAKEQMTFPIPAHYVPMNGTGLYRSLLDVQIKYGGGIAVSIDTVTQQTAERCAKEFGDRLPTLVCMAESVRTGRKEIVDFHCGMFRSGQTGVAITAIRSVSEQLTKLGVPNEWMVPTEQDIIVSLERALLATETRRSKESQMVIGLINIDNFSRTAERQESEHEVQRLKLDIQRVLLGYAESLDGHFTPMGGDEYLFVTTRGIFERETGGYKRIPLNWDMDKTLGLSLSIGIGFGYSANQAGTHARMALRQAKEAGGNVGFIVREDRGVIGPLEMTETWKLDLSFLSPDLLKKAELAGMHYKYLSKMVVDVSRRGKTEYKTQELAQLLGVTTRTVHRLLVVWQDEGLVHVVGEERTAGKGRPKQIFNMSFLSEVVRKSLR